MRISRREFLVASALAAAANPAGAAAAAQPRRLNLLWIMTDQQPVSTIHAYGNETIRTPNLDRIASAGARFDRCHIAAFPCSPSRACMWTGRYSHNHGVLQNDVPLADDVPALGDIMKAAGYATGYVGKWHLAGNMYRGRKGRDPLAGEWYWKRVPDPAGFKYEKAPGGTGEDAPHHGFDTWAGGWKHYRSYLREAGLGQLVDESTVGNHNDLPSGPEGTHIHSKLPAEHHMASFFAREAVRFIEDQKDAADPFALVVSFYGPHLPVAPPKPWDEMYSLEDAPLPPNHDDDLKGKPGRQLGNRRCYRHPEWSEAQFRDYVRRYWGYCSYIDQQIGRVLDALDAAGKADDTIVLFTSDHGDMLTAHGFVFKLCWCGYDELLRVPLLVRWPGRVKPGTRCDALVSSVDILPTLLDMMDVPAPAGVEGRSFAPLLTGDAKEHRQAVFCNSMEKNLTAVTDTWKYVLNWNPRDLDELYDLGQDPGELDNLAYDQAHAGVVKEMQGRLADWLRESAHPYAGTILAAMHKAPEHRLLELWPEVTDFKHLGGDQLEYVYAWHAVDEPPKDMKYWSFSHFAHPKYATDGDIVFRDTTWPDPATTDWQAGNRYPVGPIRVRIPEHAGPGEYAVRIGLYNPDKKTTPGDLVGGQGNSVTVGQLNVEKKEGKVTHIAFRPAQSQAWFRRRR